MSLGDEQTLWCLVLLGVLAVVLYLFIRWVMDAPRTPDPWDSDTEKQIEADDAVPICRHCLAPQNHSGWFCPECGATVGPYCNYMPYLYIFSQGEVLRAGTTEHLRRSALIVAGYLLMSLGSFAVVAPIYWFFLFRNLFKPPPPTVLPANV